MIQPSFEAAYGCTWPSDVSEVFMFLTVLMKSKDVCMYLSLRCKEEPRDAK